MSDVNPDFAPMMGHLVPQRSAYEVITDVVKSNPTVAYLMLVSYVEGPNWRDLPHAGDGADVELIVRGLQQDRGERILTELPRTKVSAERLRNFAESLPNNRLLGVASRVLLEDGGGAHIPMMDFMCVPSAKHLELVTHLLTELRHGRGCLLDSGKSYHYYGIRLLTEEEWKVFLGKCLLMSGYTDDRYIGHQLVDGYCVLRLSSGKWKGSVPTVVAELS
jgi:hypothetical protein